MADQIDVDKIRAEIRATRPTPELYGVTKVIIGASYNGRVDYDQQLACNGFTSLDIETELNLAHKEFPGLSASTMLVDGVPQMRAALLRAGRRPPIWFDYPVELVDFYGRKIESMTWGELNQSNRRAFVKMSGKRRFQPMVANFPLLKRGQDDDVDLWNAMHIEDEDGVLVSEPVDFVAEWRAFVLDGEILDVRQYRGDWRARPDTATIEAANAAFHPALRGYAIDFGLTAGDGRTLVVETNAGYSLGAYGLRPELYARLLAATWAGIWGPGQFGTEGTGG